MLVDFLYLTKQIASIEELSVQITDAIEQVGILGSNIDRTSEIAYSQEMLAGEVSKQVARI